MTRSKLFLFVVLWGLIPVPAHAQAERYELGRRLKQFEGAWEKHTDSQARERALSGLPKVTQQFFSFQFGEAGRTLDTARWSLLGAEPPAEDVRWATPLYLTPSVRLVAAETRELEAAVAQFYKPDARRPEKLVLQVKLGEARPQELAVEKFPAKVVLQLPALARGKDTDELEVELRVLSGDKLLARSTTLLGRAAKLEDRLEALTLAAADRQERNLESATLNQRLDLLKQLRSGGTLETDYPAAALLLEAELIAKSGKLYFGPERSGQFFLGIPTGAARITACRLLVPKNREAKKPVPLVVALHGAGGSENLFFEGYGAGQIVRECEKRGWLLVAPRSELNFGLGGGPPVKAIVEELAKRYPVDTKRVFIVGHSMGASQSIEALQKTPGLFKAAAALGGSGQVRDGDAVKDLPVFVGVGTKDFALAGAKSLAKKLSESGARVTFKEYEGVEHLVIVRSALPDVFALFDTLNTPAK